jgi:phage gp45-like
MTGNRTILKALGKLERKLRAAVRGVVRRAVIRDVTADTAGQTVQASGLADDVRDGVELFEPYGFTSSPPNGAEALLFSVGGDTAHQVAICAGNRTLRLAVGVGEVAVYNEAGASIVLRDDGSIEVYPAAGEVVRLGGPGGNAVARIEDGVSPSDAMIAWASVVEAGVNVAAPGSFTPANNFGALVQADFAQIAEGGEGSEST